MSCRPEALTFDPLKISRGSCKRLQSKVRDALLLTGRWWFVQFLELNYLQPADSMDTVHDLMHYTVFACLNPHVQGRLAATTLRCKKACTHTFALKQREIKKRMLACKNELHVQQRFHDTCLVDSFRALGVPVPYECHGPFWALADGNEMLKPFGKCLCPTLGFSRNGKYVVHKKNHFLAVSVCDGEARVHMSNRPHETEYLSSMHGPWDCIYELQNISQLSGSSAATAENMKSDSRGGSSRIPGLSNSESSKKSTRREKSVSVISWRWTNILMLHPCLRKLLPDPSQADVSCRAWEAQLRLCRRAFSSIAGIRRDNVSALLQDSLMQKPFITLFIDVLDTTQDSALWQRAAASMLAHARWPCHLPQGSVPLRIETCIPEAFHGFLVAEMGGVCLYCPMDAGGRRMSQDMMTNDEAAVFFLRTTMSRSRDPADMIAPLKALPSQLLAQVLLHLQNVSKSPNSWMRFAANSVLKLWQQSMSSDRQGGSSKLQVDVWKNILHMCADISCFQRLLPCCLLLRDMLFDADTWTHAALDLTSLHMHVHVAPAFLAAMRRIFAKAAFVRVRYCHGEEFRGAGPLLRLQWRLLYDFNTACSFCVWWSAQQIQNRAEFFVRFPNNTEFLVFGVARRFKEVDLNRKIWALFRNPLSSHIQATYNTGDHASIPASTKKVQDVFFKTGWQHVSMAWTSHEFQVCVNEVVFPAVGIDAEEIDESSHLHSWSYPYGMCSASQITFLDFEIRPLDFVVAGPQLLPPCQFCSRRIDTCRKNHCCRHCMKWFCNLHGVQSMRTCNNCRASSSGSSSQSSDSDSEILPNGPRIFVSPNSSLRQSMQGDTTQAGMQSRNCIFENTADTYGGCDMSEAAAAAALRQREKTLDCVLRCMSDCINRFSELLVLFPQASNFTMSDELWNARLRIVKCLVAAIATGNKTAFCKHFTEAFASVLARVRGLRAWLERHCSTSYTNNGNYAWREDASLMTISIAATEPDWISEIHGLWREKHLLNMSRRRSVWLSRLAQSAMDAMGTPLTNLQEETCSFEELKSPVEQFDDMDCDPVCEDSEDVTCTQELAADAACCSKNVDQQIRGVQVVRLLEHVSVPSWNEDCNKQEVSAASSSSDKSAVSHEKLVLHLHEHIEADKQSDAESGNDLACFCRTPTSWSHADMEEVNARGDELSESDPSPEAQSRPKHDVEDENVRRPLEREVRFQGFVVQFDGQTNRYMPVGEDGCFLAPSFLSAENAAAWFVHGPGRSMHMSFALQAVACMPVDLQQHMLLRMSRFSARLDEKMSLSCRARACLCGISLSDQLEAEYWHSRVSTCADAQGGSVQDYNKYSSCHDFALLLMLPTALASRCIHFVAFVPVIVKVRATCRMMDALILNSDTWKDIIVDATSLGWQSMHANSVVLKLLHMWRASGVVVSSRSCVEVSTQLDQVYLSWKMYNSASNSIPGHWFFFCKCSVQLCTISCGCPQCAAVSFGRGWLASECLCERR